MNVKRKEVEIARAFHMRCCAEIRVCLEKKKLRQNVLDGADFVRDVRDTYLSEGQCPVSP